MKLLLFLLMPIFNFIYTPILKNESSVSLVCSNEVRDENILLNSDGSISFFYNDFYLFSSFASAYDYTFFKNNICIVYSLDNFLYFKVYDCDGKSVKSVKMIDDIYVNSRVKINVVDSEIILFSTVYRESSLDDIKIIVLDEKYNVSNKIYKGSSYNERFEDLVFLDSYYYLVISHDMLAGGDFKIGGKYVLAKMDSFYNVLNTIHFKEEELMMTGLDLNNSLNIVFKEGIYKYDLDLNQIIGLKFPFKTIYSLVSFNNCCLFFFKNKIEFYDIKKSEKENENSFILFNELKLKDEEEIDDVYVLKNKIYIKVGDGYLDKIYELIFFDDRSFTKEMVYLDNISSYNKSVYSFFKEIKLKRDEESYNLEINGDYIVKYKGDGYENEMSLKVLEEENVKDGMIYPLYYKLYFTGTAFLNNKMIYNNYMLDKEGEYTLELYSSDREKRVFNFKVVKGQDNFLEYSVIKSDFIVEENQDIKIDYKVNKDKIDKVIISGKEYKDYTLKDGIISINFSFDEEGFFIKRLEKIDDIIINDIITFNVYKDDFDVSLKAKEEKKRVKIDFFNETDKLRCFNLYLDGAFYKSYPLSNVIITLPFDLNYNNLLITASFDSKGKIYSEKSLLSIDLNENKKGEIGAINVSKKEEFLREYSIILNDKASLSLVKVDDTILYEHFENDNKGLNFVIILFALADISLYSVFLFKYIKLKKR